MRLADPQRPLQNLRLHRRLRRLALHGLPDLLIDPRHRHKDRRLYRLHRRRQQIELRAVRQLRPLVHQRQIQVPRRDMRKRQKRDAAVRSRKFERHNRVPHIARQVVMRQHHALRHACRPGGIDNRRQILRRNPLHHCVKPGIPRLLLRRSLHQRAKGVRLGIVAIVHHDDVLDVGQVTQIPRLLQLLVLLARTHHHHLRARVHQHVADLLRRQRRIQRHVHPADRKHRKVRHRPLPAVLRQDRNAVALAHAPSAQRIRQRPYPPIDFVRSNRLPSPALVLPLPNRRIPPRTNRDKDIIHRPQIRHPNAPIHRFQLTISFDAIQQNIQHLRSRRLRIINASGKHRRTQQLVDRAEHAVCHHSIRHIGPEDPFLLPPPHHLPHHLDVLHQMMVRELRDELRALPDPPSASGSPCSGLPHDSPDAPARCIPTAPAAPAASRTAPPPAYRTGRRSYRSPSAAHRPCS